MPIIMSSALFKFYLLSLIFICALSWITCMPSKMTRAKCFLTPKEREIIYNQLPAVYEQYADAESESAYDLCDFQHLLWT